MLLFLICLFCALQPLFHHYYAAGEIGEDNEFHRFIVEPGFKPAIFGSYSFDPIKQVFEITPRKSNNTNQVVNETYILSTAVGTIPTTTAAPDTTLATEATESSSLPPPPEAYRKGVAGLRTTRPTTAWWARNKPSSTRRKGFFV